jgi:PTH1 family peptidyl-tRNA hydrolase
MGWLQKRPQVALPATYYTTGQNTSLILVGLGNIGKQYAGTRHNIGFDCLDHFVNKLSEMSDWVNKADLKCLLASGIVSDTRVIAIKPTTLMNLSGDCVSEVVNFYKIQPDHLVVIHDDLDVDFGSIRTRYGGSSAGHNGIKSISSRIGENYGRIRIGIGPKKPLTIDSADYVLQKFNEEEVLQLNNLKQECMAILSEFVYSKNLSADTRSFIV